MHDMTLDNAGMFGWFGEREVDVSGRFSGSLC